MAYVVTEPCRHCKYTYCAAVCPVEAFREGTDCLYIDPEVCIDCNKCRPECPVEAIYPDYEVPSIWRHWTGENARKSKHSPLILDVKVPLKKEGCVDPNF
ncbi:indolepyruvate ferredoxin oxidoreductase subunit alpha [Leptospira barantonii]|uniref:Ferredoxin n=1 Tax=Leptospira barantonii TaxID=2023184 RepID=A0ABX4NKB9_9LEPT|nr:4Fe-4S binding protein [Leptospira barantonii]PJZ57266.1 ferredoxin [Leptospira barantonii]